MAPCPFLDKNCRFPCPGYIIYYSTDVNAEIHDWVIEPVVGNRLTHQIQELTLDTPYFFKIQARNSKGMGPMSEAVQFRTPKGTLALQPRRAVLLGKAGTFPVGLGLHEWLEHGFWVRWLIHSAWGTFGTFSCYEPGVAVVKVQVLCATSAHWEWDGAVGTRGM